jgi:hypothetical protein
MTDQNTLAQPPQISADGQWRWDGTTWVPNAPQTAMPQPPAPQKTKMGLGKKVLIGVGALVLIGAATNMGGGDETTPAGGATGTKHGAVSTKKNAGKADEDKAGSASKPAAATPDNTTATANGPLVWGNWETVGPIEPKNDGLDMFGLAVRVKNTGESPDQGIFQATVLKKNRILATFDCISADEIAPGATTTVDCLSTDDFVPGWDEITIEDAI